jgi:hypothetical protein
LKGCLQRIEKQRMLQALTGNPQEGPRRREGRPGIDRSIRTTEIVRFGSGGNRRIARKRGDRASRPPPSGPEGFHRHWPRTAPNRRATRPPCDGEACGGASRRHHRGCGRRESPWRPPRSMGRQLRRPLSTAFTVHPVVAPGESCKSARRLLREF